MKSSERSMMLKPSPLHVFFKKARLASGVINLGVGELNFPTPLSIKNSGQEAINRDYTKYTPADGTLELKMAAAMDFRKDGIDAVPENTIISAGAKVLLAATVWATCSQGDEFFIPAPFYPPYKDLVETLGGKCILLDTQKDKFSLRKNTILEHLPDDDKTRGMILNSPNNPTGMVWDWNELQGLSSNLFFIVDETYHRFLYNGKYVSLSSLSGMEERTITIRSCSKTFAMTGWRVGYLTGPQEAIKRIRLYLEMAVGCPNSIAQKSAIVALEGDYGKIIDKWKNELFEKMLILSSYMDRVNIYYQIPQAGFYIFADISHYGIDCEQFAEFLLENAKVVVTPGIAFGHAYSDYVRFSFAGVTRENLQEAIQRIDEALKAL